MPDENSNVPGINESLEYQPGIYEFPEYQPGSYESPEYQPVSYESSEYQPGSYEFPEYQAGSYESSEYQPENSEFIEYQPGNSVSPGYQPGNSVSPGYQPGKYEYSFGFSGVNQPIVSLSSSPAIVSEGGQLSFDLNLSQAVPEGGLTVSLALLEGTVAPEDIEYFVDDSTNITNFELVQGEDGSVTNALVTIAEGATTAKLVSNVVDDGVAELEESAKWALEAGEGYRINYWRNLANYTLTDFPVVSLSSEPLVVSEGDNLIFNFELSKPTPAEGLTVKLSSLWDTDPAPGDIEYLVEDSTNITNFELSQRTGSLITDALVTLAGDITDAQLVFNVIEDGISERPEIARYALAPGNDYSIDPTKLNSVSYALVDTSAFSNSYGG